MKAKYRWLFVACLILITTSNSANANEDKKAKSNSPFEMVIFNVGSGRFEAPKITSGTFVSMPSTYDNNKVYTLGVEVPFYKDYTALGFQFDMIKGQEMGGADFLLSVKFRLPLHFKFGDIALTNTYRAGLTTLFYTTTIDGHHETSQLGVTGVPSIGIDYFPIRWVGVYCEYSWNFTDIFLNKHDKMSYRGEVIGTYNKRYAYRTKGLSLGLKLTF